MLGNVAYRGSFNLNENSDLNFDQVSLTSIEECLGLHSANYHNFCGKDNFSIVMGVYGEGECMFNLFKVKQKLYG